MARFIKCNAKMQRADEIHSNELMGLQREVEEVYNPICIDLERVVTYLHHYDQEGNIVPGHAEITLVTGGYIVIDIDFQKLDKMLRGVDK